MFSWFCRLGFRRYIFILIRADRVRIRARFGCVLERAAFMFVFRFLGFFYRCGRCCFFSSGGRRSGKCFYCRSTCRRCCRYRYYIGIRLRVYRLFSGYVLEFRVVFSGGRVGGYLREWYVLFF